MNLTVLLLFAVGILVARGRPTAPRLRRPSRCKGLVITSATIKVGTGVVTLTGKVKCTGTEGIVHLEPIVLSQKQGNTLIKGLDEIGMDCGDPSSSFTVVMDADEGQFQPGRATVSGKLLIGSQFIALCPVAVVLKPAVRR